MYKAAILLFFEVSVQILQITEQNPKAAKQIIAHSFIHTRNNHVY